MQATPTIYTHFIILNMKNKNKFELLTFRDALIAQKSSSVIPSGVSTFYNLLEKKIKIAIMFDSFAFILTQWLRLM